MATAATLIKTSLQKFLSKVLVYKGVFLYPGSGTVQDSPHIDGEQFGGPHGTAAAPGYAFNTDKDTGLYRAGANVLGVAVGGSSVEVVGSDGRYLRVTALQKQGAPAAKTTSTTLTAAEIIAGLITGNQGAAGAANYQLPLAADVDTALPNSAADDAFDFSIVNISTVAAEDVTITTNTGWTLVGEMTVESNDADRAASSGRFRCRKTAAGAWTIYRIA